MIANPSIDENDQVVKNGTNSTAGANVTVASSADGPDLNQTKAMHDAAVNESRKVLEGLKNAMEAVVSPGAGNKTNSTEQAPVGEQEHNATANASSPGP